MVNVYIKERINDQKTICAGGVTSNTTYLGLARTHDDYGDGVAQDGCHTPAYRLTKTGL